MRLFGKGSSIVTLIFPFLALTQEKGEDTLSWSSSRRLEWADYKGKPDPGSDAAASTATYLGFEYSIHNQDFSFKISCRFSKNNSWGVVKNEYILSHEQGHFDIAEIFARRLNKKMGEYQFNKDSYRRELDNLYNDILEENEKMQKQYDSETDYSRNKIVQAGWLKKIYGVLEELKNYSGY